MFATVAGLLVPAIPSLIGLAERLFSGKEKAGTDKKDMVVSALREIVTKYAAVYGVKEQPVDGELSGMVEAVFQQIRARGDIAPEDEGLYLVRGNVTRLRGAATQ